MDELNKVLEELDVKQITITKSKSFYQGSVEANWSARFLFTEISKNNRDYLKPSFIYALASIIEARLNCIIVNFCFDRFGDNYKRIAKSYLKMTIHDKLNVIVPMISDYKFDINRNKDEMKDIRKIIDIRNQFIHIKSHYKRSLWIEMNDGSYRLKELDENELGIYDRENYEQIDLKILKKLYRSQKKFANKFDNLEYRIKRKNFNPQDWILPLKNEKEKIVIKAANKT